MATSAAGPGAVMCAGIVRVMIKHISLERLADTKHWLVRFLRSSEGIVGFGDIFVNADNNYMQ